MNFQTTNDWFGQASIFRPEMFLELTETTLRYVFRAQKVAHYQREFGLGDFVEGLWEFDVAELFLAGPDGRYQEINVSPTGAWWSAHFLGYRELDRALEFKPKIEIDLQPDSWQVSFEAALSDIVPWQGVDRNEFRVSPTAILYDPAPQYFAWNHPGGGEPDFHQSSLFLTWE